GADLPPFALDRPEDFFRILEVRGPGSKVVVGRDTERDGRLAAYGVVAYRPCYVNGALRAVPQFLEVFISPEYRNAGLFSRGCAFYQEHVLRGDDFAQSQVCVTNQLALKVFTSGRGGGPAFLPYGRHALITLPLGDVPGMGRAGAAARRVESRRAQPEDIPALDAFFKEWGPTKQFFPAYEFGALGTGYYLDLAIDDFFLGFRNGRLAGVVGVWDQGRFKSTHTLDGAEGNAIRGGKPLFLHAMLMEENDPAVMAALVDCIRAAYAESPFGFLTLGLDAEDPLRYGLEHLPQGVVLTHHLLVTFGKDPRPGMRPGPFYLESARC
ncbi:MAG TPA: hypothetical protein VK465_13410, partial [Fibrobacteria bacterium]|nr:hypothetical protein [Fibrobacteria bacterium]